MDLRRFFAKRAGVWLVLGLIGGGIAGDAWWRQHTREMRRQLTQLQAGAESEQERAAKLGSQLSTAGSEMTRLKEEVAQLSEQLKSERELRHRYEDLVAKGRK